MALSDSELTTVISAASALAAIAAAVASIWSAKVARDAAGQSSQQARLAILRDMSQSVTVVTSRTDRISELVTRLKVARQTQFGLAGRNVAAATPFLRADEEKRTLAEELKAEAHALENRDLVPCSEEELQAFARRMASCATRLATTETDLVGELERVEAENREARTRNHRV